MEEESDADRWHRHIREAFSQHYQGNPVDMDHLAADWEALNLHMIRRGFPPSLWPPFN